MGSKPIANIDRIAAIALDSDIDIERGDWDIRVAGLPRLSLAVADNGLIPFGQNAAKCLSSSLAMLRHLYTDEEAGLITQLESLALRGAGGDPASFSRKRGIKHPMGGLFSRSHYYPAFVSREQEHEGLGTLRALLLRAITHKSLPERDEKGVRRIRHVLCRSKIREFHETASPILQAGWSNDIEPNDLVPLLDPYFERPIDSRLFANIALKPGHGAERRKRSPTPKRSRPGTRPNKKPLPPRDRDSASGVWHWEIYRPPDPSIDAPPPDEIPPDDIDGYECLTALDFYQPDDEPTELEQSETIATATFEFEQLTRLHLEGTLLPDSDRVLTQPECRLVWRALEPTLSNKNEATDPFMGAVAAALMLMLITGRNRAECIHALRNYLTDHESLVLGAMSIGEGFWRTSVQWLPDAGKQPEGWFHEVATQLRLPLPTSLNSCIQHLKSKDSSTNPLDFGETPQWTESWAAARDHLRTICPRFTESRCMRSMAVSVYLRTGHTRESQWLTGGTLEHPTAGTHYYAASAADLAGYYAAAIKSFGIETAADCATNTGYAGAPRAGIRFDRASVAVGALSSRSISLVNLSKGSVEQVINNVQVMGSYLAIMFAAATAHRSTAHIGTVTRRDFLPVDSTLIHACTTGISLVADKTATPALDARVCALPTLVMSQLAAYIRQLERLNRLLTQSQDGKYAIVAAAAERALSGAGPLWFDVESYNLSFSVTAHSSRSLSSAWPEWELPLARLRHLFASNAGGFGVSGADLAQQMGHAVDEEPYGAADPDAPALFANRISESLEQYLSALNFALVGSTARHDPPAPIESLPAIEILSAYTELKRLRRARAAAQLTLPTDLEKSTAAELVAELESVSSKTDVNDESWIINPLLIRSALDRSHQFSIGVQQSLRQQTNELISRLGGATSKKHKLRRPYVPPIRPPLTTFSQISHSHFAAATWAFDVEARALHCLKTAIDSGDNDSAVIAGLVLLSMYGAGTTVDGLIALVDPTTELHAFSGHPFGIVCAFPVDRSEITIEKAPTQLLTSDAVALVTYIRRQYPNGIEKKYVAQRLASQLNLFAASREAPLQLDDVLRIVSLAREVYVPGTRAAWEAGQLSSVGPTLSRLAPIFGSTIPPNIVEKPQTNHLAAPTPTPPGRALTLYRELRALVYRHACGNSTAPTFYRELEKISPSSSTRYQSTNPHNLLVDFVKYMRYEKDLAPRTVYDYLTRVGLKLASLFGGKTLIDIAGEDIEQCIRVIATNVRSGDPRRDVQGVASASFHLSQVLERFDISIDLARIFDGFELGTPPRNGGYWTSSREMEQIQTRISERQRVSLETPQPPSLVDELTIAKAGSFIQSTAGLRISEVSGLLKKDLYLTENEFTVHLHDTARRRLKSRSSKRVIRVPLTASEAFELRSALNRLSKRDSSTGDLLLGTTPKADIQSIGRIIAGNFSESAALSIQKTHARTHIARHNYASAATLVTHPLSYAGHLLAAPEINDGVRHARYRLAPLLNLPRRIQFRYLSRQLGHASAHTTLTWYAHPLALLSAQAGPWCGLPRELESRLLGQPRRRIERWRSLYATKDEYATEFDIACWNFDWLDATVHSQKATANGSDSLPLDVPDYEKPVDPLENITCALIAQAALLFRKGIDTYHASHALGLTHERYINLLSFLHEFDRGQRLNYLTGRRQRPQGHLRVPRASHLTQFFRRVDQEIDRGVLDADALRSWVHLQTQKPQKELYFTDSTSTLVSELLAFARTEFELGSSGEATVRTERSDRLLIILVLSAKSWLLQGQSRPKNRSNSS